MLDYIDKSNFIVIPFKIDPPKLWLFYSNPNNFYFNSLILKRFEHKIKFINKI